MACSDSIILYTTVMGCAAAKNCAPGRGAVAVLSEPILLIEKGFDLLEHLVNAVCGSEVNTQLDIIRCFSKSAVRHGINFLAEERKYFDNALSQFFDIGFTIIDFRQEDFSAFPDMRKQRINAFAFSS